jgi:hypothetical protein
MFILDTFIGWVLRTIQTAAEAEMDDDTALREQLLEAEMRREMGEISDEEFGEIEADLLGRIREIKERREGGAGALTTGAAPIETSPESRFHVEASVAGDFHEPAAAPHTTIVEAEPGHREEIAVLDMEPGEAQRASGPGRPLSASRRTIRTTRTTRTK